MKNIAQIVVGLPIEGPFDYLVPDPMKEKIAEGCRVLVPFGPRRKIGFVVGFPGSSRFKSLKSIMTLLDDSPSLDGNLLRVTKAFAQYYGCSWGEAIETSLPDALRRKTLLSLNPAPSVDLLAAAEPQTTLVHDKGATKRWPYLVDLVRKTMARGQGVIILAPEVAALEKLQGILSQNQLPAAVLDKRLSDKKELEEWSSVREGRARLVIGTRSAVFAPVSRLGLIVVLGEENPAYRQEQSPSYHVREVVRIRSEIEKCPVVFVSSTPSAEVWWQTRNPKTARVELDAERTAPLQIIDMSNYKPRKRSFISYPLQNNIQKTLEQKGKVLLFLNRKGFSTSTRCNQCGHVIRCPRCEVALTYLFSKKQLVCHLCGQAGSLPNLCPNCRGSYLRNVGTGIEKIESELARAFPQVRVTRFDKDSDKLSDAEITIATQAVVKKLDQIPFSLVGVLEADAELNRPDFRSAQRVFSLLINFRQFAREKVVVQTFNPGNYAIKAATKLNFKSFYKEELALRKELGFPPFSHLVEIGLRGESEEAVFDQAKNFYDRMAKMAQNKSAGCEVLEPQPDLQPKLRDKYRFTIMVKAKRIEPLLKTIKSELKDFSRKKNVVITVNIDP